MKKNFQKAISFYKKNKIKIWSKIRCIFAFLSLLDAIEEYLKEDWK